MAADRTDSGNPRAELPEISGRVRPLRDGESPFAIRLTATVDKIRQLYTRFGIRPYRVFLVHTAWGGSRVGSGAPVEISRVEILPTPRVRDMSATNEVLRATGLTEEGNINVDQISAKYSEDDLMGRTPDIQDPALQRTSLPNIEFFWEIAEARNRSVPPAVRRRYVPTAVPMLTRDGFQWGISLTRQDADRSRQAVEYPRNVF